MTEYEIEPIPGLPGIPPRGERILWQGSPEWRSLARTAFHSRAVAGYFALLAALAVMTEGRHAGDGPVAFTGAFATIGMGIVGVALLHALAWWSARTTIYTLTDRRVVLRIGMAVPKCINLPLGLVGAVDLRAHEDGSGDLPLRLTGPQRLGYAALWPHAKPLRMANTQPMLRAIPDAAAVATLLARTCLAAHPTGRVAPVATPADTTPSPAYAGVAV